MMNYFTKRGLMSVLLLLLALTGARAEDFVVDGIKYSTDSKEEVTIKGYENIAGDIVIPSTVTYEGVEYAVTDIYLGAFYDCSELTSVEILAPLHISYLHFRGCPKLQAIHISEENPYVSSINGVVYNKEQTELYYIPGGLKEVTIPPSVTYISGVMRSGCTNLQAIHVSEENPHFSSINGVVYDKEQTTLLYVPEGLKAVSLPSSVTTIDQYAFYDCSILESIDVSEDNATFSSIDGMLCNKDQTELVYVPEVLKEITVPASVVKLPDFSENLNLTSIEILGPITEIGGFSGCTNLTTVKLPASVESIGWNAFQDCVNLTSIECESPSVEIGQEAFSGCSSLTSLDFLPPVNSLGEAAFYNCTGLTTVQFKYSPWFSTIPARAFANCTNLISIEIPFTVYEIKFNPASDGTFGNGNGLAWGDGDSFYGCSSLQSITVDERSPFFSSIDGVLYNKDQTVLCRMPMNSPITEFTIPASVTDFEVGAFYGCNKLTSVEMPSSVTNIEDDMFSGCTGLTSIEIPSLVASIGDNAFFNCVNLTSVNFKTPSSVTSIGENAFSSCTGLTSIEIPSSVTTIGSAFSDCVNLASVKFEAPSSLTSISGTFSGCTSLTSIAIPSLVTTIGEDAFRGCTGLTSIEIPSSVNAIESYAFYECSNLASVKFEAPSSLTTIGGQAFNDCPNLKSMAVPPSVKEIKGYEAFDYSNLDTLVIPHSVETMSRQLQSSQWRGSTTFVVLNSNKDVLNQLPCRMSRNSWSTCYSTSEILDNFTLSRSEKTLYTVSDARNTGGTLTLSLTDIADEVLQIRALEINGQRVEANESSAYTFEGVGEGTEFELVVYADILNTEYPIYQTITVEKGEVSVGDVKSAGDGQPEVRGSLAEGRAWVRIPGDGGTAEWTLTATDGTAVAQGRAQADGNWQLLEGAQAAKGLYLLTVRCGQTAKTVKFMAR